MRPSPAGPLLVAGATLRSSPSRRGLPSAGYARPKRVAPPPPRLSRRLTSAAVGRWCGTGHHLHSRRLVYGAPPLPATMSGVRVLTGRGGWGAFVAPSRSSGWPEVLLVRVLGVLGGASESRCSLAG
jgi:hypothetical protein